VFLAKIMIWQGMHLSTNCGNLRGLNREISIDVGNSYKKLISIIENYSGIFVPLKHGINGFTKLYRTRLVDIVYITLAEFSEAVWHWHQRTLVRY
jgi:hypothetical protein